MVNASRSGRLSGPIICGLSTFALLVIRFHPTPAVAQAKDPRELEARKECLAGRYQKGIDVLADLFTESGDPNYIFNQARCFQQNNRPEEAISRFREYLRKAKDLPKDELAEVQGYIKECEDVKGEQTADKRVVPPPAPAVDVKAVAVAASIEQQEQSDRAAGRRMRIVGIVCGAVGVAAIGGAIAMGLRAQALERDFEARYTKTNQFDKPLYNQGQRAETLQWITYGVGAVGVGVGALFYYLGTRTSSESVTGAQSMTTVTPVLLPSGAGAAARFTF